MVKPPVQQVIGPDPLADAAHAIENLKDEKTALTKMHTLMLDQAMNWFQIGGTLLRMKENEWFAGHASFGEMTWSEFGFKKSKAYYLIGIYETMVEAGVTWEDVEEIGWSKLRPPSAGVSPMGPGASATGEVAVGAAAGPPPGVGLTVTFSDGVSDGEAVESPLPSSSPQAAATSSTSTTAVTQLALTDARPAVRCRCCRAHPSRTPRR